MTRARYPMRDEAERTFRYGVDLQTPEGGFGAALDAIHGWPASQGLARASWALHGAGDVLRAYFDSEETAKAFQQAFGGRIWSLPADIDTRTLFNNRKREAARIYL